MLHRCAHLYASGFIACSECWLRYCGVCSVGLGGYTISTSCCCSATLPPCCRGVRLGCCAVQSRWLQLGVYAKRPMYRPMRHDAADPRACSAHKQLRIINVSLTHKLDLRTTSATVVSKLECYSCAFTGLRVCRIPQ